MSQNRFQTIKTLCPVSGTHRTTVSRTKVGGHREHSLSSLCHLLVWAGGHTEHSCCSSTNVILYKLFVLSQGHTVLQFPWIRRGDTENTASHHFAVFLYKQGVTQNTGPVLHLIWHWCVSELIVNYSNTISCLRDTQCPSFQEETWRTQRTQPLIIISFALLSRGTHRTPLMLLN